MPTTDDLLRSIDTKVTALLTLVLDAYLRQTGVARPKERSVDTMLFDVGVPASTIASLLGKTDRAVRLQVQADKEKKVGTRKGA
jgi:hypothetical protein